MHASSQRSAGENPWFVVAQPRDGQHGPNANLAQSKRSKQDGPILTAEMPVFRPKEPASGAAGEQGPPDPSTASSSTTKIFPSGIKLLHSPADAVVEYVVPPVDETID